MSEKSEKSEIKMDTLYEVISDAKFNDEEKVVFLAALSNGEIKGPIVKKTQYIINYHVYEIHDGKLVDVDPPTTIDNKGMKIWKNSKGEIHRDNDLPAKIDKYGNMNWYRNGLHSRDNGKPTHVYIDGTLKWKINIEWVRVIRADGSEMSYADGKIVKSTAPTYPAVYYYNKDGNFHNTTEPTIINGKKIWYEDNIPVRIE